MIYIFTNNEKSLKAIFPKNVEFLDTPLSKHSPQDGDITYLDISDSADADIKKILSPLKKACNITPWGIIDPKGIVKDTAVLFFEGASDYLGPGVIKEKQEIDSKRLKDVLVWRRNYISAAASATDDAIKSSVAAGGSFLRSGVKLPAASAFPGWKKMEVGKSMPFYLLYCALQGKAPLDERLDEKTMHLVHKKFLTRLLEDLDTADGQLWMNTGKDGLFLIPPRAKNAEEAIKTCVELVVSAPQIVLETLNIKIQSNFVFALHYGTINYKPPGKTGTIVSDAVNFVFHLGAKKSESGRLTLSGELPDVTVPKNLLDLFVSAGEFEGRKVWHTKKFNYEKPWT